jgi:hypothetical protein
MTEEKEPCKHCGYYGKKIGHCYSECCSRCETEWDLGQCFVCEGTGYVVNPDGWEENKKRFNEIMKKTKGYLCSGMW